MRRGAKWWGWGIVWLLLAVVAGWSESPRPLTLLVTGKEVPRSFLATEIAALLKNRGVTPPDRTALDAVLPGSVSAGETADLLLPLSDGSRVPLHVEVHRLPQFAQTFLMFSDHPETIRKSGLLFQGALIPFRTVRFNYYHVNAKGEPDRELLLVARNRSGRPALLHVLGATAGPSPWEMEVGHRINVQFLVARDRGLGRIHEISPRGQIPITSHPMPPGQLVSGLLELQLLEGEPLDFMLYARVPGEPLSLELLSEEKDVHARGIYELPVLSSHLLARAGEEKSLLLGDLPLVNLFPGRALKGSYGVFWRSSVTLVNDTRDPQEIGIYFQPRGGRATGTFRFGTLLREVSPTAPYQEILLAAVTVPPGNRRVIPLVSLPEGASSYPVKLLVRSRAPGVSPREVGVRVVERDGERYVSVRELLESGMVNGVVDYLGRFVGLEEYRPVPPPPADPDRARLVYGEILLEPGGDLVKPAPFVKVRVLSGGKGEAVMEELLRRWGRTGDAALWENAGVVREGTSDANGYYFFEMPPKGEYELLAVLGRIAPGRIAYWRVPFTAAGESLRLDLRQRDLRIIQGLP